MKTVNLWENAKNLQLQVFGDIAEGFSLGFDRRIPEATRDALIQFTYWVEDNFAMPITLWVDFTYNHYLLDRDGKRVGYRFYWADFKDYPRFDDPDDIPVIELPVRTEKRTIAEILTSFIEAISHYFAWLANEAYEADPRLTESVLQRYLKETKC